MIRKLLLLALPCSVCLGQSVLTTPGSPAQPEANTPSQTKPQNERSQMGPVQKVVVSTEEATSVEPNTDSKAPLANPTAAQPSASRSDFEQFVSDGIGYPLTVFGRQLFDQVPSTFAPLDHIAVPAGYVIGPGDELLIRVWGKVELDSRVNVDRNGQIFLPRIGTINVAGLKYEQLEGYLHTAVGNLYKDFDLNVTLGQLRSIQIFVLGKARKPGSYTVSALSTLIDALLASGGPSETGSMRRIELRRDDKLVTDFDIYELLQKGTKAHDARLLAGDVIYIPPAGPQVAIVGDVNDPGIYELKGETNVAAALDGAGGLSSIAATEHLLLERIVNHSGRTAEQFALDATGQQRELKDGDVLRIFPVSPEFKKSVMLRGNVAHPGRFAWREGMRVSDLIPNRESVVTPDFWNRQNLRVKQVPDHRFPVEPRGDTAATQMRGADFARGNAETDRAGKLPDGSFAVAPQGETDASQARADDIARDNTEINWEYAVIERLDGHDLSTRLVTFNLGKVLDDPASSDNQMLEAGDVITIFSRNDLPLPVEQHEMLVQVSGEVNAPGVYRLSPGETLRTLVQRAGGLTHWSYLYASQLTRVSTRRAQEEELRQSAEQMQRDLASRYSMAPTSSAGQPAEQQAQFAMQQATIARISAVRPTGRVVLEMRPDASVEADIPDFALEDGDSFYIPPREDTIQVAGAVYNQNAFRYRKGRVLTAYLNDAGGATRGADIKRIFLIRADGSVVSHQGGNHLLWRNDFGAMRLLPGDAIIVPQKTKVPGGFAEIQGLTQTLSQTALTAASLSVLHP